MAISACRSDGCPPLPRGIVIPVVTCIIPCPQSNETNPSPIESNRTDRCAMVMSDSTQEIAFSRTVGMKAVSVRRVARVPVSMGGSAKNGSLPNRVLVETASNASP